MILTEEDKNSLMDLYLNMDYSGWDLIDCTEKIVLDKLQNKLKNAERYEWLREQDWTLNTLCIVENPRVNVKLGAQTYSWDLLDKAIDSAIVKERN